MYQRGVMRPSRVLAKLRSGKIVFSYRINLDSARAVELAAMEGFDCIWICLEHGPSDLGIVERQIYAAKAWDTDTVVRVPRGSYSDYIHPLEMDATGIMVPHIMSLEDAKQVVRMTRFHPIGRRAMDSGYADAQYASIDLPRYAQQANAQRFVILQIEDPEPLADLEAIAALEGFDILFYGPGDFSHALGVPGKWDHPKVTENFQKIAKVAAAHGKVAGTVASLGNLKELIAMGYRFINLSSDVHALREHCRKILEAAGQK